MESITSYANPPAKSVVPASSHKRNGDFAPAALEVTGLVNSDFYEFSELPEENAADEPRATGRPIPHGASGNIGVDAKDIRSGLVDFLEKRQPSGREV